MPEWLVAGKQGRKNRNISKPRAQLRFGVGTKWENHVGEAYSMLQRMTQGKY